VTAMIERLGPELPILERLPVGEVSRAGFTAVADAIDRVRKGDVATDPGADGEYGSVHLPSPALF
jgi:PHP family Zn ribbon phosphoesterase